MDESMYISESTVRYRFLTKHFSIKLLVVLYLMRLTDGEKLWVKPNPRYLPFPMGLGNKIQIITGFGIPVDLKKQSLSLGLILKTNYELPTNVSIFTEAEELLRKSSGVTPTRWMLYKTIETVLTRLSLGGRDCLLRSVCQAADATFGHDGVIGEILQLIFMPSSSAPEEEGTDPDYIKAELLGREQGSEKCNHLYPGCATNLLDIISIIHDVHEEDLQVNFP